MVNFHGAENIFWPKIFKKRCKKRHYEGIHDRFLRDDVFRRRMIENNRDEKVCRAWDVLADEDHTYRMSLSTDLWRKPQTNGFHEFILFCCG